MDDEGRIRKGIKKIPTFFKEKVLFKNKGTSAPKRGTLFSPEDSVGMEGLKKYVSEVKKGSRPKNERYNRTEPSKEKEKAKINVTGDAGEEIRKFVDKKVKSTTRTGDGVGSKGLDEFIAGIPKKPDLVFKKKSKAPEENICSVPAVIDKESNIHSKKSAHVHKASNEYVDPIPNFKINLDVQKKVHTVKDNYDIQRHFTNSKQEKARDIKLKRDFRNKTLSQSSNFHNLGVVSVKNAPVGKDGLKHYVENIQKNFGKT